MNTVNEGAKVKRALPFVRLWLFGVAAIIVLMVVVGGATRLTDSGLSITEWKPLTGALPPMSAADWASEFAKYKTIPEYREVNKGMSLAQFKGIYWWEWGHRLLGRLIGFAFAVPFVFFWLTGRLSRGLLPKLAIMFVLGGLQGVLGWYMVMSGLSVRVDVSQYRLAAHLGFAVVIFGYILWVAMALKNNCAGNTPSFRPGNLAFGAALIVTLMFAQIALGGLVAGLKAGLTYNTWPLMDGSFIPQGLFVHDPWYLAPFEDILTVQFDHRMLAYLIVAVVLVHLFALNRRGRLDASAGWLASAVLAQIVLGIWTLLAVVPISLALAHQGFAIIVFGMSLHHLQSRLWNS
ncbi:MAG: heme A synthase [bacterium]|nr:heme A synthase [bacterium]